MANKKVSEEHEAYKSRGMRAGHESANPGNPKDHPMPKEESELSKAEKK